MAWIKNDAVGGAWCKIWNAWTKYLKGSVHQMIAMIANDHSLRQFFEVLCKCLQMVLDYASSF